MNNRVSFNVYREGNAVLGNYYRITAWRGSQYLGEQLYAGYARREAIGRARERVRDKGELFA